MRNFELYKVIINYEGGAYNATKYLIESGCKKIALITPSRYIRISKLRTMGYLKAIDKYDLGIGESYIVEINDDLDVREQIEALFEDEHNYPDAVLAVNGEKYASISMQIAKEKGLVIPDDFSVIAFTDGLISKHTSPRLTTVAQHGYEMGKQAVALLIDRIESKDSETTFQKKVISTNLKIRESTRQEIE